MGQLNLKNLTFNLKKSYILRELVRATLIMFREFNTLELTFCVEFIITLLREMLKSSTLSITLFLLMCMCVFGMGGWSVWSPSLDLT